MTNHAKRDALIAQAVADGKITDARGAHYARMYDRDPAGTEKLLGELAPALKAAKANGDGGRVPLGTVLANFGVDSTRETVPTAQAPAMRQAPVQAERGVDEGRVPFSRVTAAFGIGRRR